VSAPGQLAPLRVGIAGCGLMGRKRAAALGPDALVGCYDVRPEAAKALAGDYGAEPSSSLEELLGLKPDVVIVATVHDQLAPLSVTALSGGAHVLVEKPAGMGTADVDRIAAAAAAAGKRVKVGFNHRFHPAVERAVTEARSGQHGEVLFMRARYGHGGRLGYEREWRADPARSGGGELVDQGMHLLDLSYWLLGALPLDHALLRTHFWAAPVEDTAVVLLGDKGGVGVASPWAALHVGWTEWKNIFSLEIMCRNAKLAVDGLVGSYGNQCLSVYRMRPELGPPDVEAVEYPARDVSWEREWRHFTAAVRRNDDVRLLGDLDSARYAWQCVQEAQRR
jgi:predicted dehydrogenase